MCFGCMLLSEPDDDAEGAEALGGDITFSYMYGMRNGRTAHTGVRSPTR
jgi:hypothetical protein